MRLAWEIITGSVFSVMMSENDDVIEDITTVIKESPFSENLLRNILDLTPSQQLDLCRKLAKGKDSKGRAYGKKQFKEDAVWYRAYNQLWELAGKQLSGGIPGRKR